MAKKEIALPEMRDAHKRALEQAALADRRSASAMAMIILEQWLKEKGFLK
jgi:hypothetical protein